MPAAWASAPALFRHELEIEVRPGSGSILTRDAIRVENAGAGELTFRIAGKAEIRSVLVNGEQAKYTFHAGRLALPSASLPAAKPISIGIEYETVFDDPLPVEPSGFDNPGFGVEGTVSEKGVFLLSDSGWYPRADGENSFNLTVTAPLGIYAVTAGEPAGHGDEGEKSFSRWKVDGLGRDLSLSAARYVIRSEKSGGTAVYTYLFPESESLSQTYLKAAASHIQFYESLHGKYAFPKFAVVENFFPTGYGFPSYTLLGSQVLRLPFIPETSLRHEIAHCWWGNGVLVDYESGNWSEGLTTYVADYLAREAASPAEAELYRRRVLWDYASLAASRKDLPLSAFTARVDPATRAVGYGKAAFVFHMIRKQIGDEAFWDALRRVYARRFQVRTSWDDFRKEFAAEGRWNEGESKRFFEQWISRPGAPRLSLADIRETRDGAGWKVEGTVVQSAPFYNLDADLALTTGNGKASITGVRVGGASTPFAVRSPERPEKIALDPESNLFRLLYPEEIPATVNSVKGSQDLVAVISSGAPSGSMNVFDILLAGLNHPGMRIVSEDEADPRSIGGSDLIFFGFPASDRLRRLFSEAPPDLKLSPDKFSLGGFSSGENADSLFTVFTDPSRRGRLTALFMPAPGADPGSMLSTARKITHYGQYSHLVFSRGTNREKGTWEVLRSPLIHRFEKTR